MRGTPHAIGSAGPLGGIIPAYAGNTSSSRKRLWMRGDHPRVCGEHRILFEIGAGRQGSSPRMRGTHILPRGILPVGGIIPAYAGNTLRDYSNFVVSKFMSFVFHLV